eukprot:m.26534 g.26534  ORF g.26534 m.26534 type:complete len:614 (+) comp13342_c0_seq2:126-1967(+)
MTSTIKNALPAILEVIPQDWRGTTYKNHALLGRAAFAKRLAELAASGRTITTEAVEEIGTSEDYFRVASNFTTTLEAVLAEEANVPIDQVFTFGSNVMPVVAACLTTKGLGSAPVRLYCGDAPPPFADSDLVLMQNLGVNLEQLSEAAPSTRSNANVVLELADTFRRGSTDAVDGVVSPHCLLITNPATIKPEDVLVIRKRLATPVTNPMAEAWLQQLAGVTVTANQSAFTPEGLADFNAHLQTLSGTAVDAQANPVTFTAGLPALSSMWLSMISRGGADVVMASTAYGGSSQLTDVIEQHSTLFRKTKYHVQGDNGMVDAIRIQLTALSAHPEKLFPTTVLFSELPTNPDMKVPDLQELAAVITEYKEKTGKKLVFLADTTFAPGSQVLKKFSDLLPDLPVLAFISLSKSVSRGLTTGGTIVANATAEAKSILKDIERVSAIIDTNAKKDQLVFLSDNHRGVEQRCKDAYDVHVEVGTHLVGEVHKATGVTMPLCTVTPKDAAVGFTSSTFSFNLPSPKNASAADLASLAQRFVDLLCEDSKNFKPCVSFGQDNGVIYCTVPATSTQGAIKEEDKAKQAVGGVQLTRLSFPPTVTMDAVKDRVTAAIAAIYA